MNLSQATIYFDGAAQPNPGHGGAGWVILDGDGTQVVSQHEYLGNGITNNVAEWHALVKATIQAKQLGFTTLAIFGDSKMVVEQAGGRWKAKAEHIKPILAQFMQLTEDMSITTQWLSRDDNSPADDLSKRALTEQGIELDTTDYAAINARRKKAKARKRPYTSASA